MMARCYQIILLTGVLSLARSANARLTENFDAVWKFLRGVPLGAERPDLNDAAWKPVTLPHDWCIAGIFANNDSCELFQVAERRAFHGACTTFVKSAGPTVKSVAITVKITASATGLKDGSLTLALENGFA
jgi:hypothetical protein